MEKKLFNAEDVLLEHSQNNLDRGGYKIMDGGIATVFSQTVEADELNGGRPTVIPLIWDGEQRSTREAIFRSLLSGKTYPSADSIEGANKLAQNAHNKMAKQKARTKSGKSYTLDQLTPKIQQQQLKDTPPESLLNQMAKVFIDTQ